MQFLPQESIQPFTIALRRTLPSSPQITRGYHPWPRRSMQHINHHLRQPRRPIPQSGLQPFLPRLSPPPTTITTNLTTTSTLTHVLHIHVPRQHLNCLQQPHLWRRAQHAKTRFLRVWRVLPPSARFPSRVLLLRIQVAGFTAVRGIHGAWMLPSWGGGVRVYAPLGQRIFWANRSAIHAFPSRLWHGCSSGDWHVLGVYLGDAREWVVRSGEPCLN